MAIKEKNGGLNPINDPNTIMNWVERAMKIVEKNGLWKIMKTAIAVFIFTIVGYIIFNPSVVVKKINEINFENHKEAIDRRTRVTPEIRLILRDIIFEMNCSRAFVLELHNGNSNAAGLPFTFCSMKYEEVAKGFYELDMEYQNVSLSRFKFFDLLFNRGVWVGSVNELMLIDSKLGMRIKSNGTEYMALVAINGEHSDIGFLGISFNTPNHKGDYDKIIKQLRTNATKLSLKLDKANE